MDAINADYSRACELSVFDDTKECLKAMELEPFGHDVAIERFYSNNSVGAGGEATASITFGDGESEGQTASAGIADVDIERHGDEYKVHFEVSITR